eukprot:10260853-Alexandrium_andersonii.AAC.1
MLEYAHAASVCMRNRTPQQDVRSACDGFVYNCPVSQTTNAGMHERVGACVWILLCARVHMPMHVSDVREQFRLKPCTAAKVIAITLMAARWGAWAASPRAADVSSSASSSTTGGAFEWAEAGSFAADRCGTRTSRLSPYWPTWCMSAGSARGGWGAWSGPSAATCCKSAFGSTAE